MSPRGALLTLAVASAASAVATPASDAEERVDFARDVKPLLAARCFECHGPDANTREADLRLDTREGAFGDRGGYAAFVPGDPDASEAFYRIVDADDPMPPSEHGPMLEPAEIELLRSWIEQGAEWRDHWAYVPPTRPALPAVRDAAWPRHPIDRFVLARLEAEGLAPSPEEDPAVLLRRASLDLRGLPPTPEEVDALLADPSPDAYERAVDRLLDSPAYGEHLARPWLDLARYADTDGYEKDSRRTMWRYRDWVIEAFRSDLPFDEFTRKQLAGDLLPNPSVDDLVATGFHRNTMTNLEGGVDAEEFRVAAIVDRVNTTADVWLGTTMSCVQCHDHKYDPFSQREYYELFAFFDQSSDDGRSNAPQIRAPTYEQRERIAELERAVEEARAALVGPDPTLDEEQRAWEARALAELPEPTRWAFLRPTGTSSRGGATLRVSSDGSIVSEGALPDRDVVTATFAAPGHTVRAIRIEPLLSEAAGGRAGRSGNGNFVLTEVRVERVGADGGARSVELVGAWSELSQRGGDFRPQRAIDGDVATGWAVGGYQTRSDLELILLPAEPIVLAEGERLRLALHQEHASARHLLARTRVSTTDDEAFAARRAPLAWGPWSAVGPFVEASGDAAFEEAHAPELEYASGVAFSDAYLDGGLSWTEHPEWADGALHVLDGANCANYVHREFDSPGTRTFTLQIGSDDAVKLWIDGQLLHANLAFRGAAYGQDQVEVTVGPGRHRLLMKVVNGGGPTGFVFADEPAGDGGVPRELVHYLRTPERDRWRTWQEALRRYFRENVAEGGRELVAEIGRREAALDRANGAVPTALVMTEREQPRTTHVLGRGSHLSPGEVVTADVPDVLHPWPASFERDRLGLAEWLVDARNPLTARVTVNRYWEQVFGTGLVSTSNDFGVQGETPSHPELLDWLAVEFRESGWSVRELLRSYVTSATYRQSARVTPALAERDPDNRLLARGPRFRLEAEVLRDSALFASGLLTLEVGGPSVFPPQPDGTWAMTYSGDTWRTEQGANRWRRGLYTFWRRTAPYPTFLLFDAPSRELACTRRSRTNTPLQALALLNDPVYVEAAGALARRMLDEAGPTPAQRVDRGFRLCLARAPGERELGVLVRLYEAELEAFRADPDAAAVFARGSGMLPTDGYDPSELAAWTAVANALLNVDEMVTKG